VNKEGSRLKDNQILKAPQRQQGLVSSDEHISPMLDRSGNDPGIIRIGNSRGRLSCSLDDVRMLLEKTVRHRHGLHIDPEFAGRYAAEFFTNTLVDNDVDVFQYQQIKQIRAQPPSETPGKPDVGINEDFHEKSLKKSSSVR